jgi:hypothetical protein
MISSIDHLHVVDTSGFIAVTNTANGVYILSASSSAPRNARIINLITTPPLKG